MSDQWKRDLQKRAKTGKPNAAKPVVADVNDDDTPAQLAKAKSLIQEKRYDDARAILITLDHPTADKWLERLSAVAPAVNPAQPALPVQQTRKAQPIKRKWLWIAIGLIVFAIIGGVLFKGWVDTIDARVGLSLYCSDTGCDTNEIMRTQQDKIMACYYAHHQRNESPLSATYMQCFKAAGL